MPNCIPFLQEPGHSLLVKAISETGTAFLDSVSTILGLPDEDLVGLSQADDDEDFLSCRDGLLKVYNLLLTTSLPVNNENILSGLDALLKVDDLLCL